MFFSNLETDSVSEAPRQSSSPASWPCASSALGCGASTAALIGGRWWSLVDGELSHVKEIILCVF